MTTFDSNVPDGASFLLGDHMTLAHSPCDVVWDGEMVFPITIAGTELSGVVAEVLA